jgi:prepilin-type N-terminal cleavage/methylation domain-containing protein
MCRKSEIGVRKGFTLVELAVVIVIIGVLAAFGVPRFLKSVERSKAAEAFQYLAAVRAAEERFIAKEGVYTSDATKLDITQQAPKYYNVTGFTSTSDNAGNPTWTMTLTRIAGSSSYGAYTVVFSQDGYSTSSGINAIPDINPLGSAVTSASSS